jgi:hypothetical protein
VAGVFRRVERRLAESPDASFQSESCPDLSPLLALTEASARGVIATGPRRGCRVVRVRGVAADTDAFLMGRLCAQVQGYNLQCATRIAANDREGLERMARYLARPPIATDRLVPLQDGRLELRLKRPWRDGTTAFQYTPHELLERLIALVPRPRHHLTRYHGVLAPAFAGRAQIVPSPSDPRPPRDRPPPPAGAQPPERPGRWPWASLIWRVFLKDVLACTRCSGRMAIVAALTGPDSVILILKHSRLCGAYAREGAAGLVSKRRGQPSNRRLSEDLHRRAVELVRDLYADFGPTLAREKLIELHGIRVAKETLRKWMAAAEIWLPRDRRVPQPPPVTG